MEAMNKPRETRNVERKASLERFLKKHSNDNKSRLIGDNLELHKTFGKGGATGSDFYSKGGGKMPNGNADNQRNPFNCDGWDLTGSDFV
jgi:hypothetical protein